MLFFFYPTVDRIKDLCHWRQAFIPWWCNVSHITPSR